MVRGESVDSSELILQERYHDAAIGFTILEIEPRFLFGSVVGAAIFGKSRRTTKIVIQPDCGLKYLPLDVASKKCGQW